MRTDFFDDFPARRAAWLDATGPHADIVVSTRARLARNVQAFAFPHRAEDAALNTIAVEMTQRLASCEPFAGGWCLGMAGLGPTQRQALQEMLVASPALAARPAHRFLVASGDLALAALINEEDHLRLLAYRSGFDPQGAVDRVLAMDRDLDGTYEPAFAEDLGYLTASPTNVGTGLRISALLHLPGLVMADEIDKVLNALRQLQFTVRGLYGDGRAVRGALFQIANVGTLGRTEREMAQDFDVHVGKIVGYERAARDLLLERDSLGLEDLVQRGLAILARARLVSGQEASDCLSQVRLGVGLDLLPPIGLETINRTLLAQQGAHLDLAAGRALGGREKTAARASLLREVFARL